jgi:hypothetical protein
MVMQPRGDPCIVEGLAMSNKNGPYPSATARCIAGVVVAATAIAGLGACEALLSAGSLTERTPAGADGGTSDGSVSDSSSGPDVTAADAGDGGTSLADGGTSADSGDAACPHTVASRVPVYLLMILDGSGSMSESSKWTAAVSALGTVIDDFATKADPNVAVGLIVFSDSNDPTIGNGPYPTSADVPPAFVGATQATALHARIDKSTPSDGTPTLAVLNGAYTEIEKFQPVLPVTSGGQPIVLIATDGVPTDGSGSQCFTAATNAHNASPPAGPVSTFVVGVGIFPSTALTSYDPTFLGQLAQAGGAAPTGCNPKENADAGDLCYFQIDPTKVSSTNLAQAFVLAVQQVRAGVACTFRLLGPDAGTFDPSSISGVSYDDGSGNPTTVAQDPVNGWTFHADVSSPEVILHGTACTLVQTKPKGALHVGLTCGP